MIKINGVWKELGSYVSDIRIHDFEENVPMSSKTQKGTKSHVQKKSKKSR